MSMRDEMNRAGDFVEGLNGAIRENPLAAGLIGAGLAWMLMGGSKGLGFAAGAAKTAATKVGSAAVTAGTAVSQGVSATAREIKNSVSDAAGSVTSIVPDMSIPDTDKAYDAIAETGAAVRDRFNSAAASGRAYGNTIQGKLSENLERQPLLLGALGLVIGAGIASTFATTALESELIGEKSAAVRDTMQSAAEEAKTRARQVLSEVQQEFTAQGLTPGAAKDAASDVAGKVKSVAGAARESVARSIAGSPKS